MVAQAKIAEPTVVNGINVDDLFALIEGVRRDAAKGKTNWRVTTTWQGQTRSRAQVEGFEIGGECVPRRFTIDIDEPCELGGTNRFANPQEHLLAALNACMTVGYVAQCAVRGITLQNLQIETDGETALRSLGKDSHTHAMWECNGSNGRHFSDECDRRSAWQCESCGDRGAGRGGGKACARTGRPTCFASRGRAALWCPPMLCSDAALHRRLSGCLVRSRPRVCFGCGLSQGAEGKDARAGAATRC